MMNICDDIVNVWDVMRYDMLIYYTDYATTYYAITWCTQPYKNTTAQYNTVLYLCTQLYYNTIQHYPIFCCDLLHTIDHNYSYFVHVTLSRTVLSVLLYPVDPATRYDAMIVL